MSWGIAKRSSFTITMRAATIARVSGILIVKVVPRPVSERISIVPPMSSILLFTTSIPTPRPEIDVTAAAVEKPG